MKLFFINFKKTYLFLICCLTLCISTTHIFAQCTPPANVKGSILNNNTAYVFWQYSSGTNIAYKVKFIGGDGSQVIKTTALSELSLVDNYVTWFSQQVTGLNSLLNYSIEITPVDACALPSVPVEVPRDFVFTNGGTRYVGGATSINEENIEIANAGLGGISINSFLKNGGTYSKKINISQLLSCPEYADYTIKAINVRGIYRNSLYSSTINATIPTVSPSQSILVNSCSLMHRAEINQFSELTQLETQGNNVYNNSVKRKMQFTAQNPTNNLQEIEITVQETYRSPAYTDCGYGANPVPDPQQPSAEYARWGIMALVYVTLETNINGVAIEKTIPIMVFYTLKTMCDDKDLIAQNGGKTDIQNTPFVVYPNPASRNEPFAIEYYNNSSQPLTLEANLYDMHGKLCTNLIVGNNTQKIVWNTEGDLQSGVYILEVKNKTDHKTHHIKVVLY